MERVEYRVEDRVAILTIENPPMNALSAAVQESLRQSVARAMGDAEVDAVVFIGAGNTFVAGADIKQLERLSNDGVVQSILPQIIRDIEGAPKHIVAAIDGSALGGVLEIALGAHYRIASPNAKLEQPEVKLGLIPGAGGTQRLARLAGVEAALEMCVFGEPIRAEEAMRLGIIDRIAEGDLLLAAIQFANAMIGTAPRRTRDVSDKLGTRESNALMFTAYRERVRKTRKNLLAPAGVIDAIEAATELPFDEACRTERETYERLLVSIEAKSLIHVFFAEGAASKIPGVDKSSATIPIQTAAVVGAGTMGRGIAMCFANAGIPVLLKDAKPEALDAAVKAIEATYQSSVTKGRIKADEMRFRLSKIQPRLNYAGFDGVEIVIEAAFENIEVKRSVFTELGGAAKSGTILATNTSYLNIDEIAAACPHPECVIGLHFFSPANVMRLIEIVPGKATAAVVTASSFALAKKLGKIAIQAGNCPGFIGNRMLRAYRREAQLLLEEGASPRQVDSALEEWGMAMGPFAVQDLSGIDIAMRSQHVFGGLERAGVRKPRVMELLYSRGRLGQKTGAGWYRYDDKRGAVLDPEVDKLIEQAARESGKVRRSISPEEIIERTIYALVNEAARILEEGHALRASDIDLVYINGYGFPSYRGGPMRYADEIGLRTICKRALEFNWKTAPLVVHLAESGGSFSAWDRDRLTVRAASQNAHADHA